MIRKEILISVELFQDNLGDDDKGIIMMVLPIQAPSDKKFLKLPS